MGGKDRNSHVKVVIAAVALTLMMVFSSFGMITVAQEEDELVLRVAMQDDIRTTNPLNAGGVWTWNVIGYLYDGPINVDIKTEELIPYIAVGSANLSTDLSSVDWSDCTVGTFGFNQKNTWANPEKSEATVFYDFTGVAWHDDVQMSIYDLLFSYHVQAQMPDWTSSVNCLKDKGGRTGSNYPNDHRLYIDLLWESPDNLQAALKFTLQEPFADFFRNTLSAFLLPSHIWGTTAGGQSTDTTKIWYEPGYLPDAADAWSAEDATAWDNPTPVGSGPFEWNYWDQAGGRSRIDTWRGHFYEEGWGADNGYDTLDLAAQPNIDAIEYKIYKTAEAAVLALKNDDVDYIAWSVPPTFVGDLANEPGVTLQQSPEQGFFYLSYNMRKQSFGYDESASFPYAPEDDVAMPFRKAIAHCIDKEKIVQRLLLNFGIKGEGPVSKVNTQWYNSSIPKYSFDPDIAIDILTAANYKLTDGVGSTPGPGNWWLNPDGSPIGSSSGGKIDILTPQADYDPIRAQAGIMIADQLQDVGIYAESRAMDFGSIVDRIDQRQFDMYILGWRIGSDPTDFLHAFFHSSTSVAGQNYPGYQNESFDEVIDRARQTGNEDERKIAVKECQAAVAYDLPYDVLYFRTNIEAYRSDNFVGWQVGSSGSIFNWRSIMEIKQPSEYYLNAQFVNIESAMYSNQSIPVSVLVKDQDGRPIEGANVFLNATLGALGVDDANTTSSGKVVTTFTAPYVPPTEDNIADGVTVMINIREATYTEGDREYDPATSKLALVKVYPEGVEFLSVSTSIEPDVIDPDIDDEGTLGFTIVDVLVKLHTDANPRGDPVQGMTVYLEVTPDVPTLSATELLTDSNGKATFTLTSTDLPKDDGSVEEFKIIAKAYDMTSGSEVKPGEQTTLMYIVDDPGGDGDTGGGTPFPTFLVVASLFCVGAVGYGVIRRIKK